MKITSKEFNDLAILFLRFSRRLDLSDELKAYKQEVLKAVLEFEKKYYTFQEDSDYSIAMNDFKVEKTAENKYKFSGEVFVKDEHTEQEVIQAITTLIDLWNYET